MPRYDGLELNDIVNVFRPNEIRSHKVSKVSFTDTNHSMILFLSCELCWPNQVILFWGHLTFLAVQALKPIRLATTMLVLTRSKL
jgi:hypothetical protein